MGILSDAKNLYVVSDRIAIKDYTRDCVNYWLSRDVIPILEQVAEDLFDSDEFTLYSYPESKELVRNDQLEMISVYDFAKNVQNLVSFNMPDDFDESFKTVKNKKLSIKEGIECSLIDELNSLDVYKGSREITYKAIEEYERVLDKFPDGTVIGMDWSAGNCYFRKVHKGMWDELISPHYNLRTITTYDTASWLAERGNWCKKPLWLDDAANFESIASRKKGSSSGTNFFWSV